MANINLQNIKAPKDIFTKIYRSITKYPERYEQWAWHLDENQNPIDETDDNFVKEVKSCGSAHCFAGWGLVHTRGGVRLQKESVRRDEYGLAYYQVSPGELFNQALINAGRAPVPIALFHGDTAKERVKRYVQRRAASEASRGK